MSDSQFQSDVRFVETGSDTETRPPKQRRYTAAYKLRLIDMADACTASGEVASLLRKEGIYSSTLTDFRKMSCSKLFMRRSPVYSTLQYERIQWG